MGDMGRVMGDIRILDKEYLGYGSWLSMRDMGYMRYEGYGIWGMRYWEYRMRGICNIGIWDMGI